MKKGTLNEEEKKIERDLLRGRYKSVSKAEFEDIARTVAQRKKRAVLNIRLNSEDLESIKRKAKRFGIPYQSFISEILHRFAA